MEQRRLGPAPGHERAGEDVVVVTVDCSGSACLHRDVFGRCRLIAPDWEYPMRVGMVTLEVVCRSFEGRRP